MSTKEAEKEKLKHQSIAVINKMTSYRFVENISEGEFGDVVALSQYGCMKAGKIVVGDLVKDLRIDVWSNLDERNILKLEETLCMPQIPSICFIMDRHFINLYETVNHPVFGDDPNYADDLKRWLLHILTGLDHIHKNNLCHLNLNASNILITYNSRAMIGGFSHVRSFTKPVTE